MTTPPTDRALPTRFVLAGLLNTAVGYLVFSLALWVGCAEWQAILVALIAGVGFNFLSMGGYAFRDLTLRRLPAFVTAYLLIYAINVTSFHALNALLRAPWATQAALTPLLALASYLLLSRWVFRAAHRD